MVTYNEAELKLSVSNKDADIVIVNDEIFNLTDGEITLNNVSGHIKVTVAKISEEQEFGIQEQLIGEENEG